MVKSESEHIRGNMGSLSESNFGLGISEIFEFRSIGNRGISSRNPHAGVDDGVAGAASCAWTGGVSGGVSHRASAGWAAVLRPVPSPRRTTTVLWGGEGGSERWCAGAGCCATGRRAAPAPCPAVGVLHTSVRRA